MQMSRTVQRQKQHLMIQPNTIQISELFIKIWHIGFTTFNPKASHKKTIYDIFVQDLKCISEDKFKKVYQMCQSIPGPKSTQLLITLSIISTKSVTAGLLALLLYTLPILATIIITHAVFNTIYSLKDPSYQHINNLLVNQYCPAYRVVLIGILINYVIISIKNSFDRRQIDTVLVFFGIMMGIGCGCFYFFLSKIYCIIGGFGMAALVGWAIGILFSSKVQNDQFMENHQLQLSQSQDSILLGAKNKVLLFSFLLASICYLASSQSHNQSFIPTPITQLLTLFSIFYILGCLTFGNENVILPLMISLFPSYHLMYTQQYYNSLALYHLFPGNLFNLGAYIGGNVYKVNYYIGSVVGWLGLNLPSLFALFYTLSEQKEIPRKKNPYISLYLTFASLGFILAGAIELYLFQLNQYNNPTWIRNITIMVIVCIFGFFIPSKIITIIFCLLSTAIYQKQIYS